MASLFKEFATKVSQRGHGTIGSTIFGEEPDPNVDNCLWMRPTDADEPNRYLDTLYANIDVWSRNKNAETGRLAMESLRDDLHRYANFDLPSYHVYFCHVLQDVIYFETDTERRHLHKMTFRLIYRKNGVVS